MTVFILPAQTAPSPDYTLEIKGYSLLTQGEPDSAVPFLVAALQSNPNNLEARRYLGYSLLRAGRAYEAVQQFTWMVNLKNPQPSDFSALGDAYFYSGNFPAAIQNYSHALQSNTSLSTARWGLVNTYLAQSQPDQAIAVCQEGIEKAPDESSRQEFSKRIQQIQNNQHKSLPAPDS